MSTVGDRIIALRRQIPDLPPTLPAPTVSSFAAFNIGGNLATGTYYCVVTQLNAYGETLPSTESSGLPITGPNGSIQFNSTPLPGAAYIRIYITLPNGASGSEIAFAQFPASAAQPFSIGSLASAGSPPVKSTAWMADSDGQQFSASTVFEWLSDGLNKLSHAVNGLLDYCGVQTFSGQGMYTIPGQWLKITDVWYGGYWIQGGSRAYFYRRNAITSDVLSNATISVQTDKQCIEVFYQPDRNSGVTTTTSAIGTTDTSVNLANIGAFLLPFGFAMIGTEIVCYYQLSGSAMSQMIRGLGNTVAQAWPIGTTVIELSLFWCGSRIFNTAYTPGTSATTLPIPAGWTTILDMYTLAQAKKAEQDLQSWKTLEDEAFKQAERWMYAQRGVMSRVQVGGGPSLIVYDDSPAGGVILP